MNLVYFVLALVSSWPFVVHGQSAASIAYTPKVGKCPHGFSLVRKAGSSSHQTLSPSELEYLQTRKSKVLPEAWKTYLANVQNSKASSLPSYVANILNGDCKDMPNLGIATSGGGYRAALFGAAVLNSLDGRNSSSVKKGTGGLLQTASYLSGLSGGSWLVTSLYQANFPTMQELIFGSEAKGLSGWMTEFGILAPTNDSKQTQGFVAELVSEIRGKHDAGFPVTFADVWAMTLARHFLTGTTKTNFFDNSSHGAGKTFSGLADLSCITSHTVPLPIITADSVSQAENISNILTADGDFVPLTNPIYEFNIFEMGSYDPILSAFTPMQYLGTTNSTSCVTGYDQAALILGTSSELFNEFNISATGLANSPIGPILEFMNATLPQPGIELDVSRYPNPFHGVAKDTFIDSSQTVLDMVDGGEDGGGIPLQPMLVKARKLDVIFAIDADGNSSSWADGIAMIASQNRTTFFPSAYSFPPVPNTTAEFISSKLTTQTTFFGCDTPSAPFIIYLANGGPPRNSIGPPLTNASTIQDTFSTDLLQEILNQAGETATQGNSGSPSVDPEWSACLACAVVDRVRHRSGKARAGVCASCFDRYCWSGK